MKEELDKQLCDKYPKIFRDRHGDMKETAMCWGFCCGQGWFDIIDDLCKKLQHLSDISGVQIIAVQVKEKFGTLRFYITTDSSSIKEGVDASIIRDLAEDAVSSATNQTQSTCEVCGEYGKLISTETKWLKTLCDKCNKERKKEHRAFQKKVKATIAEKHSDVDDFCPEPEHRGNQRNNGKANQ